MAVHNTEAYLQEAIDSVLTQTLSDLELIVVDDGSTDGSWSIVAAAAARDRRVIARQRLASGGASRPLNDGLRLSTGRYITRQDGDDASLPTRLADQVSFLEAAPEMGAVGTQAVLIDAAGKRLAETSFPRADAAIQASLVETMCFVGPTVMARRSAFERAGLWFDEELSGTEDYDLCLRLSEVAPIGNLERALYLYRQHGASVSHSRRHLQLARKAMAVERAITRRLGPDAPPDAWSAVARDYLRAAVVAHAVGESEDGRRWSETAVRFHPGLLADSALVEHVVRRYLRIVPEDTRPRFVETLFDDVLPRRSNLTALRKRLAAELHVSVLLTAPEDSSLVADHLWPAIRSNPRWLLDRGVLARLMKSVGRSRGAGSGPRA